MRTKRWRSLAFRLWMVGLLQIGLVVLGAFFLGPLVGRVLQRADMAALSERISPVLWEQTALDDLLLRLRKEDNTEVSIYDSRGRLHSTNVHPPLSRPVFGTADMPMRPPAFPPPRGADSLPGAHRGPPPEHRRPGDLDPPPRGDGQLPPPPPALHLTRLETTAGAVFVVARFSERSERLWSIVLVLGFGALVVLVGFLLTARLVTWPLRRLTQAVNSFGAGDLSMRAELTQQDEIGALGQTFDEMADRVQELRRSEKELLANVAHELRTPLARVRVALDIARETDDPVVGREIIEELGIDLSELETLIDDLLTAARLEASSSNRAAAGFALHLQSVNCYELLGDVAEHFRKRHPERAFDVQLQDELPTVAGDPVLCRRALSNLLENAHKYSPDQASLITLRAEADELVVRIEVLDKGLGIDAAFIGRVFEPFFRAEQSRTRAAGGVGLGLSLARRIAQAHGGEIQIESELGVGTCARVTLPRRQKAFPTAS